MKKLSFLGLVLVAACNFAKATTINFEQYPDSTQITNQYAGVAFTSAVQLTTANPSNDFLDFPAHSGQGVITNDPGQDLSIAFDTPQDGVSVFYTDFFALTMSAYDASNNLLGSTTGASNIGTSSMLTLNLTGISSIVFTDNTGIPDQFVLDDLTYGIGGGVNPGGGGGNPGGGGDTGGGETGGGGNPGGGGDVVPEPSTFLLMGSGLLGFMEMARRRMKI